MRAKKTEKVKREPETVLADTSSIPAPRPAPRTTTAAADTSMDPEKKVRERFLKDMSAWIVKILTPYRNSFNLVISEIYFNLYLSLLITNPFQSRPIQRVFQGCTRGGGLKLQIFQQAILN